MSNDLNEAFKTGFKKGTKEFWGPWNIKKHLFLWKYYNVHASTEEEKKCIKHLLYGIICAAISFVAVVSYFASQKEVSVIEVTIGLSIIMLQFFNNYRLTQKLNGLIGQTEADIENYYVENNGVVKEMKQLDNVLPEPKKEKKIKI